MFTASGLCTKAYEPRFVNFNILMLYYEYIVLFLFCFFHYLNITHGYNKIQYSLIFIFCLCIFN